MSPDDPRSAYVQIADDLRRKIATGSLKAGEKLKSNGKLAEEYGVVPMTVRHALGILRDEGLVVSQQGRGTWIASDPPGRGSVEDARMADELAEIKAALGVINSRLDRLEGNVRERS